MLKRVRLLPVAGFVAAATTFAGPAAAAGLIPTFMSDHSLCCGPGKGYGASLASVGAGPLARAEGAVGGSGGAPVQLAAASVPAAGSAMPAAPAASAAPAAAPFESVDGYLKVGFDRLGAFRYVPPADVGAMAATTPAASTPPASGEAQIPADIKSLDGKKTIVTGFMLPVKLEEGLVTEFLLVKDPMMCCYGVVPNVNEWVVVRMAKGVKPLMDVPVAFHGTLRVKEMFENGFLAGIYLLEGEKMGAVSG